MSAPRTSHPLSWFGSLGSSGTPMHEAIVEALWNAIDRGDLRPGDRIEGEVSLAERLGVSRSTVNRAMETLRAQGLIERRRSLGTRVVGRANETIPPSRLPINRSNPRVHGAQESDLTERVLRITEIDPSPEVRRVLQLDAAERVTFARRLVLEGRRPVAYLQNWVPARILSAPLELRGTTIYSLLTQAGHDVARARQWYTAEAAHGDTAVAMGIPRGAAVLTLKRVSFSDEGHPVEFAEHKYRPDRYRVELDAVRPD